MGDDKFRIPDETSQHFDWNVASLQHSIVESPSTPTEARHYSIEKEPLPEPLNAPMDPRGDSIGSAEHLDSVVEDQQSGDSVSATSTSTSTMSARSNGVHSTEVRGSRRIMRLREDSLSDGRMETIRQERYLSWSPGLNQNLRMDSPQEESSRGISRTSTWEAPWTTSSSRQYHSREELSVVPSSAIDLAEGSQRSLVPQSDFRDEKRDLPVTPNHAQAHFEARSGLPSAVHQSVDFGRPLVPLYEARDHGGLEVVPVEGSEVETEDVPPAYQQTTPTGGQLQAEVQRNGRISMFIDGNMRIPEPERAYQRSSDSHDSSKSPDQRTIPYLNIVIQVVGSRGDVQPFIALGRELQNFGHRIRLATHDVFGDFVKKAGLEFFPIGGDPEQLMSYMVNNPSIIPNLASIRAGDISRNRKMVLEMLEGCWRSCIEPSPDTSRPFVADAIIANPPSFAHIHCAQALGIPVHLMFTMPWTPTRTFPHPLASIKKGQMVDEKTGNYLSYGMVEVLTWQGLVETVNYWRRQSLNLEPIRAMMGAGLADYLKVPFTYCWSPSLVAKPDDWPKHIDVCGFFFREAPAYTPSDELDTFLQKGPTPIYVGFGSIVMKDPEKMTHTILSATREAGVRAIVSKGWSKLGSAIDVQDENVLFIDDCPHEWLFQHVSAVVHHGGAGTTACGLRYGRPTAIVPFFGDQSFWGDRVHKAGAGPPPIDHKQLTIENLTVAIKTCLDPAVQSAARRIAEDMSNENGVQEAVKSFHQHLPAESMKCDLIAEKTAAWKYSLGDKKYLKLSDEAVFILMEKGEIKMKNIKVYHSKPIEIDHKRWDPLTAGSSTLVDTMLDFSSNTKNVVVNPYRELKKAHTLRSERSFSSLSIDSQPPRLLHSASDMSMISSHSNPEPIGLRGGGNVSEKPLKHSQSHTGAAAAAGIATRELGKLSGGLAKGMLLDLPVAMADGFHHMPVLYGDKKMERGDVRGWKSGMVVGGKALAVGFYEGFTGIVTAPAKGAYRDGGIGFAKGMVTGTLGVLFKPGAAMLGFVGYPLLGAYKSISSLHATPAQSKVLLAKQIQGSDAARRSQPTEEMVRQVLREFSLAKR